MTHSKPDTCHKAGTLYIVGTPIGNLEDITYRAVRILSEVDVVAAEDTRHTGMLLKHLNISKQLLSCHEHNEKEKANQIADILESGRDVALVSDAGMPVISDPGQAVVAQIVHRGFTVTVIPGPSAGVSAFAVAGISSDGFIFQGFLPHKKKNREAAFASLQTEKRAIVLYEAPHRIRKTLIELSKWMPGRRICIVRELTKKFEEILRGTVEEIAAHFEEKDPRGEFVLVLAGAEGDMYSEDADTISLDDDASMKLLYGEVEAMVAQGVQRSEAIRAIASKYKLAKRALYKRILELKD